MDTERPHAPHKERRRRRARDQRRRRKSAVQRDASSRSPPPPPPPLPLPSASRSSRYDAPRRRRDRSRSRSRSRSRERRRLPRGRSPTHEYRDRSRRSNAREQSRDTHEYRGMASPTRRFEEQQQRDAHAGPSDGAVNAHGNGTTRSERQSTGRSRGGGAGGGAGGGRGGGRGAGAGGGTGAVGGAPRRSKLSVPDNWGDVPQIGALVASSRFVAMRVPLDDKFTRMIHSPHELWTPEIFLQTQAREGHDVRLLIDLTNTTKYYDGDAEFRDSGVKYVKLCIEGFKAPPRESEVEAFVRIVDEFVASEPHGSIAVHCTHGLNRTGYLVVSYLVQRSGMSVQDALRAFSDARPPGLIKHMYIEDLFRRFAPNASVELPQLPDWATAKYAARRR